MVEVYERVASENGAKVEIKVSTGIRAIFDRYRYAINYSRHPGSSNY